MTERRLAKLPEQHAGRQSPYHYAVDGNGKKHDNKLLYVDDDLGPQPGGFGTMDPQLPGNYQYDALGNLVGDNAEHIAGITWDLHGKVRHVDRAANPDNLTELSFWYDGTGNRVHKQTVTPVSVGVPDVVRDEWYVRDPQGNEMAVYEQYREGDTLYTWLKEHPIYGADRLGMDLNGVLMSKRCVRDCGAESGLGDPSGRMASLVIGEIMYDSPKTGDDFPAGKEYHEGEYVVLINKSGEDLDLSDYQLRVGGDSLVLADSLAAGERVIVGFGADAAAFVRTVALPAEYERCVVMQNTLPLPDRGGIVEVTFASSVTVDAFSYGDFYGLSAGNAYIADSLIDSLGRRSSLKSVQRDSYGGPIVSGGGVSADDGSVGNIDPGLDPDPSGKAVVGTFVLHRGHKVYELKNHLGNVLAVVSDVKLGMGPMAMPSSVQYYAADVVEMSDYEPFGLLLARRHYVSEDGYGFGFNGKEADDEWNGEGNMYNYGFRIHDPRLGRFLSVDPLAPDYPWYTPYQYAGNTPIQAMDLDGLEPWLVVPLTEAILEVGIVSLVLYGTYEYAGGIKIESNSGARSLPELAPPGAGYIPCIPGMAYVPTVYAPDQTVHATSISSQKAEKLVEAYSIAHSSAETKSQTTTQKKQEEKGNFVYRVLREGEIPDGPLFPKDINANYEPEGHVINGSRIKTQFISTTKSKGVALHWFLKGGSGGVVRIDLDKVPAKILDLDDPVIRNYYLKGITARNFAKASQEVLIEKGPVPPSAIKVLYRPRPVKGS